MAKLPEQPTSAQMEVWRARGAEIARAPRITKAMLAEVGGNFYVWMGVKNTQEDLTHGKPKKGRSED